MPAAYISAFVAIGLFLMSHLGLAIWFASGMKTKVNEINEDLKAMTLELKGVADQNTRLAVLEERMARTEMDLREVLKAAAILGARNSG